MDTGDYEPGARRVLSELRAHWASAFSARRTAAASARSRGQPYAYYKRLQSSVEAPEKETSFFDGIDTTLPGLYRALGKSARRRARRRSGGHRPGGQGGRPGIHDDRAVGVRAGVGAALAATRNATTQLGDDPDVVHASQIKERQIEDAIHAALGVAFTAVAQPTGTPEPTGPLRPRRRRRWGPSFQGRRSK